MEGIFVLIIVAAVIGTFLQFGLPLLLAIFAYRAAQAYGAQLEREMKQFQRQLPRASAGAGPDLLARWGRMNSLMSSMNVNDQRRYEESMASMKSYAAQNGLFPD